MIQLINHPGNARPHSINLFADAPPGDVIVVADCHAIDTGPDQPVGHLTGQKSDQGAKDPPEWGVADVRDLRSGSWNMILA